MARMSTRLKRRVKRFSRRTENMVRTPAVAPPNFRLYRFDATFRLTGVGEHHDTITAATQERGAGRIVIGQGIDGPLMAGPAGKALSGHGPRAQSRFCSAAARFLGSGGMVPKM